MQQNDLTKSSCVNKSFFTVYDFDSQMEKQEYFKEYAGNYYNISKKRRFSVLFPQIKSHTRLEQHEMSKYERFHFWANYPFHSVGTMVQWNQNKPEILVSSEIISFQQ